MGKKNEGRGLRTLSDTALKCRLKALVAEHSDLNRRVDAMSRLQAMGNNQEYLQLKQKRARKKTEIAAFEAEIKRRESATKSQTVPIVAQCDESGPVVPETSYLQAA